jgi:predicted NAD/FAD-dependent oxidoreductase
MRVAIVGAGLAGLMAGGTLAGAGHEVVLLDKGRSPGGRLATRRIGGATLDHGAQFFTVREAAFAARVAEWEADGLVRVWCRGFEVEDGYPRYAVRGGMNALAKHLATGLDVRCSTLAFALRPGDERRRGAGRDGRAWSVGLDDGTGVDADAVLLTCPLPQSFSLMITAAVELPAPLRGTDYDRTLALLTVLDRDSAVPPPGGVQQPGDPFGFIADNRAKGVSAVPAVTFHATPAWSLEWWDRPGAQEALLEAAAPWLGRATVVAAQLKRWRFATPQAIWPQPCWAAADGPGPLVLAGDAFAGPRVEGAALSGLAAVETLLSR